MSHKLPEERIAAVLKKLEEWKNGDTCVVFPYVTDLHSALVTADPCNTETRETISDILLLNRVAELADADFCANLGDIGIDVPVKDEGELKELVSRCLDFHSRCAVRPVLFTAGNHDVKKGYSPEFWGQEFSRINSGCANIVTASAGEYGFYDLPEKKVRIFWLNCNPVPGHYTDEQCSFVREHLAALPAEWCVITLQHVCLHQAGRWQGSKPPPEIYIKLHKVFADFISRGGIFAGFFTGDSHFNTCACADKVNYYVSQGYGGIGPSERPEHAIRSDVISPTKGWADSFDASSDCLIDVVAVNTTRRKAAVFRLGAGGEEFDTFWEF